MTGFNSPDSASLARKSRSSTGALLGPAITFLLLVSAAHGAMRRSGKVPRTKAGVRRPSVNPPAAGRSSRATAWR